MDRSICLVSAGVFVGIMRVESTPAYKLHFINFLPEMDNALASNKLIATGPERTVADTYKAYAGVFSKADSQSMPAHTPQGLSIKLLNGKQPSCV